MTLHSPYLVGPERAVAIARRVLPVRIDAVILFVVVWLMKCAVLAMSLLPAALAAQATQVTTPDHRDAGRLDVVLSQTGFSLKLKVPTVDVVGFEAPISNDDERAKVAIAMSELSKPLDLFVVPLEAGCFTTSANVILMHQIVDQNDTGRASSGSPTDESHAEFQADYVVQCQDMSALDRFDFAYFDRFSGSETLTVRIKADGTEQTREATRAAPEVIFP